MVKSTGCGLSQTWLPIRYLTPLNLSFHLHKLHLPHCGWWWGLSEITCYKVINWPRSASYSLLSEGAAGICSDGGASAGWGFCSLPGCSPTSLGSRSLLGAFTELPVNVLLPEVSSYNFAYPQVGIWMTLGGEGSQWLKTPLTGKCIFFKNKERRTNSDKQINHLYVANLCLSFLVPYFYLFI